MLRHALDDAAHIDVHSLKGVRLPSHDGVRLPEFDRCQVPHPLRLCRVDLVEGRVAVLAVQSGKPLDLRRCDFAGPAW